MKQQGRWVGWDGVGGGGKKGLKTCGAKENDKRGGELSNKSFSLKRITDDDGLRMGERGGGVR